MRKLGVLGLMCCLSVATPAIAATWVRVASDNLGAVYYIDSESIRRTGDIVRYWLRVDYSNDATIAWRETKSYYKADCAAWTLLELQQTNYDARGFVVGSQAWSDYGAMRQIIPDSTGEAAAEYACGVQ